MAMVVAMSVMSASWMAVIAVLVTVQKLPPPRAALDVPLAVAIGRIRSSDHRVPLVGSGLRRPSRTMRETLGDSTMTSHRIGTRQEWLASSAELLELEKVHGCP